MRIVEITIKNKMKQQEPGAAHLEYKEPYAYRKEHKHHVKSLEEHEEEEEYALYLKHHGHHFSDKLSDFASSKMENVSGTTHKWNVGDIENIFNKSGFTKPHGVTWGDVAYVTNMAYADYFNVLFKTDLECIKFAHAYISDPDGYPERAFKHWCADIEHKDWDIDWERYI